MNQDIIDYLDDYWEKESYEGGGGYYFYVVTSSGGKTYFPQENTLRLSGRCFGEGYEVQIQDLAHLIRLEAAL